MSSVGSCGGSIGGPVNTAMALLSSIMLIGLIACGDKIDPYAQAQAQALGRGVNFGNFLEADPEEGSWTDGRLIQESDFDRAVAAKIDSVRLPVRFSAHAGKGPPYTIDPAFMDRVEQVANWGLSRGLRVVIDLHHYLELFEFAEDNQDRFVALWEQIATRFKDYPDKLYFELLNEPNSSDPASGLNPVRWNQLSAKTLQAIRAIDSHHTVIVDTAGWANIDYLKDLTIPDWEKNAIVSFHYYSPIFFCFQGSVDWNGPDFATTGIVWPGPPSTPVTPAASVSDDVVQWIKSYNTLPPDKNPAGKWLIHDQIVNAAQWGAKMGRPLWMGEFTAHQPGDIDSRERWVKAVRCELESQKIKWSYWTLNTGGSALYDFGNAQWVGQLRHALEDPCD
jgi:endoglucanase